MDDRARRRDRTAFRSGAASGGALGLIVGAVVPGVGNLAGALIGGAIGAIAGALVSRSLVSRVAAEDWDPPPSERPYVGVQASDDDGAADGSRLR